MRRWWIEEAQPVDGGKGEGWVSSRARLVKRKGGRAAVVATKKTPKEAARCKEERGERR